MSAANSSDFQGREVVVGRLWWAAFIAAFGSAIANSLVYVVTDAVGWIAHSVLIPGQNQPITLFPVIINSVLPALAGAMLLATLNRLTRRPIYLFRVIALIVLLLSFAYPFILPEPPLAMVITLNLMHVVVAAITVGVLTTVAVKD